MPPRYVERKKKSRLENREVERDSVTANWIVIVLGEYCR